MISGRDNYLCFNRAGSLASQCAAPHRSYRIKAWESEAEQNAAAALRHATDAHVLDDAEHLIATWNECATFH
jgi:hypothetical protein